MKEAGVEYYSIGRKSSFVAANKILNFSKAMQRDQNESKIVHGDENIELQATKY